MKFKIVVCPKCNKKHILENMICGTHCSCGTQLHEDTNDNRKDVRTQLSKSADVFSNNFEQFKKRLQSEEKYWNEHNAFVEFKQVEIPDNILLDIIKC